MHDADLGTRRSVFKHRDEALFKAGVVAKMGYNDRNSHIATRGDDLQKSVLPLAMAPCQPTERQCCRFRITPEVKFRPSPSRPPKEVYAGRLIFLGRPSSRIVGAAKGRRERLPAARALSCRPSRGGSRGEKRHGTGGRQTPARVRPTRGKPRASPKAKLKAKLKANSCG